MKEITKIKLINAIKNRKNESIASVLREAGLNDRCGNNYQLVKDLVKAEELEVNHWLGQAIHLNKKRGFKRDISNYLNNEIKITSHVLKLRLIKEGLKEHKCENCKNTNWLSNKIPLELHHINGNHNDNRLINLQILCPNCHVFTNTYRSKNRKIPNKGV